MDEEILDLENDFLKYLKVFLLFLVRQDIFNGAGGNKEFFRANHCKKTEHKPEIENILSPKGPNLGGVRQGHLVL